MKKLAFLLFAVTFLVGCFGGIRLAKSPSEVENTAINETNRSTTSGEETVKIETYESEEFGISFQIPSNFSLDSEDIKRIIFRKNGAEGATPSLFIEKVSNKTLVDYVNEKDLKGFDAVVIQDKLTVAGQKAIRGVRPGMGDLVFIVTEHPSKNFLIEFSMVFANDLFEKVIASVEFLN